MSPARVVVMRLRSVARSVVGAALLLAAALALAAATPAAARIWRLNPDGSGDAPTIQAAVDQASDGDTLDLAPGFYSQKTSIVNKTLLVRGAGIDVTTLSAPSPGHVVALRGGANFTELRDLTITGGNANNLGDPLGGIYGGGVLGEEAHFALVRCRLANNSCGSLGGGLYATSLPFDGVPDAPGRRAFGALERRARGPAPPGGLPARDAILVEACVFENNFAGSEGGGFCFELAWFQVVNCTVRGNFAGIAGGGALLNAIGEVTGSLVVANEGLLDAGGLKLDGSLTGGGVLRVARCSFAGNTTSRYGSALELLNGTSLIVERNVFGAQAGTASSVVHCGNTVEVDFACNLFTPAAGEPYDACAPAGSNLVADPLFCNAPAGDYRVCEASPALTGDCGPRGAFGVGCAGTGCSVATIPTTWSRLKAFRR
jgi:hypothetical protein